MRNPFHFNRPTPPEDFLGRHTIVEQMVDDLYEWEGESYGVVGGRRFGKSSLLLALEHHLVERFREAGSEKLSVIPVYVPLKALLGEGPTHVFGFLLHQLKKVTCGPQRGMPLLRRPLLELGVPEYTQRTPSPASLQDLEAFIEEIVSVAYSTLGTIRFALLVDEIDEVLDFAWTNSFFGNLRSLVYDGDMKDFVRLVLAGSERYIDVDAQGSPLSNAITGIYLEPFAEDAARGLVGRAVGIPPDVANEILLQSGGHPFIIQHILHYLCKANVRSTTIESVHGEVRRFLYNRSADLEGWWRGIGENGQRVYSTLLSAPEWFTLTDVIQIIDNLDVQVDRGLKTLCSHGLVIHDGAYQRYRICGQLFRDWADSRCQVLTRKQGLRSEAQFSEAPALAGSTLRRSLMTLTGQQYQQLTDALLSAFPSPARLGEMVRFRLDRNIHALALGDDLRDIVFKLIATAEAEGWTMRLLAAARESNPSNPALLAFSQQVGLAPATPSRTELERIIRAAQGFLDIDQWRTRLGQIEAQVCRIEIRSNRGMIYGTGFLLGPDILITNYHVMEAVIKGEQGRITAGGITAKAADVILRFDYKRLADGATLNPGTIYRLAAKDWLVDQSPMSPVDSQSEPKHGVPQPDQLDYALLRVDGAPGSAPIGGSAEPGAAVRQWIALTAQAYDFRSNAALFIVQHPQGDPLQLALDTDSVIGVNANGTRVTYRTNTLPGSSGSPCFNSNWELVALHHSGDPNFDPAHKPTYNEGIPFSAIVELLEQRGLAGVLGEQAL